MKHFGPKLENIDEKLLCNFSNGSRTVLNPMAAMFGGTIRCGYPTIFSLINIEALEDICSSEF